MDELKQHLAELTQYMGQNGIATNPMPKVVFKKDANQTKGILCPTAYYDPNSYTIVLYTANRHPKDILRSYAHELYHHHQNLCGEMTPEKLGEGGNDPKYAQNHPHLRKLEEDAYMYGNILFRDYCDDKRYGKK